MGFIVLSQQIIAELIIEAKSEYRNPKPFANIDSRVLINATRAG
jgi:hypothetical protein